MALSSLFRHLTQEKNRYNTEEQYSEGDVKYFKNGPVGCDKK